MKCFSCGYELPEDSEFCQYCGKKLQAIHDAGSESEVDARCELPGEPFRLATVCPESPVEDKPSSLENEVHSTTALISAVPIPEATVSEKPISEIPRGKVLVPEKPISVTPVPAAPETHSSDFLRNQPSVPAEKQKKKYCKYCGGLIDLTTKKCTSCGKQFFKFPKKAVGITALALVFVALAGLNVYQYVFHKAETDGIKQRLESSEKANTDLKKKLDTSEKANTDLKKKLDTSETTVSDLEKKIKSKDSTINNLNTRIDDLEETSEYYDAICNALSSGNIGAASNNFKVSEGVLVVNKNQTKQVTLTTTYGGGGTISIDYEGYSALVTFDQDSWYSTTTLTVDPLWATGVTVATFSNSLNSQTFKMIIVVTD